LPTPVVYNTTILVARAGAPHRRLRAANPLAREVPWQSYR